MQKQVLRLGGKSAAFAQDDTSFPMIEENSFRMTLHFPITVFASWTERSFASWTARSRAAWTAALSGGTCWGQVTRTREKGLGMRKRSQERRTQARSGRM